MGLIDSIIGVESGGNPNATNPNSSATGAAQFISSTWLDMMSRYRPDLVQGKSPDEILAMRNDPKLSAEMAANYADQNGRTLSQAGHEATPGNTYLAHFAGPQGAVSVLGADPNAPVAQILGPAVVKANPFLANMTAGDLRAWADRKMGGSGPAPQRAPATPAAPASGLLAQSPSAGLLASPQQPGAQPQSAAGGLMAQMAPPEQAPPIFFAPRRAPDLSKLRAAFKAPVFNRTA